MIVININDGDICLSITSSIITHSQMAINISIAYDMNITILLKILGSLLIHDLYIFGCCCCLMNFRCCRSFFVMINMMDDNYLRICIRWSG